MNKSSKLEQLLIRCKYIWHFGWKKGNWIFNTMNFMVDHPSYIVRWKKRIISAVAFENNPTHRKVMIHWADFLEHWHKFLTNEISPKEYSEFMKNHFKQIKDK